VWVEFHFSLISPACRQLKTQLQRLLWVVFKDGFSLHHSIKLKLHIDNRLHLKV